MGDSSSSNSCPYATLGVQKDASKEEIKKAFRTMSLETHPDRVGGCKDRFQRVSNAASILTDEAKRSLHDASSYRPYNSNMSNFHRSEAAANARKSPSMNNVSEMLVRLCSPRNIILGPIFLWGVGASYQYLSNDDENKRIDYVQAWRNPATNRFETLAPWNPAFDPKQVVSVDRRDVHASEEQQ